MIISLGSSCSVAYQLQQHNLRHMAFPFDWIKTPSFDLILSMIENDFYSFLDINNLEIIGESIKFPWIKEDEFPSIENNKKNRTIIIKNTLYNATFCHDFNLIGNISDQLEHVIQKYDKRIDRFYKEIERSKHIHFIRDELKVNNITNEQIDKFNKIIRRINPLLDFKLTVILYNPKKKKISLRKKNWLYVINDTKKFGNWFRPNVDWAKILKNDQIINATNYRCKIYIPISVKIPYKNPSVRKELYPYIDHILNLNIPKLNYFVIQISTLGKVSVKLFFKDMDELLVDLKLDFEVICLEDINTRIYLNNKFIKEKDWIRSIDSFIQVNHKISEKLHKYVISVMKTGNNYFGLGGESGYYGYKLVDEYKSLTCISNSKYILDDIQVNCPLINNILVDYKTIDLTNIIKKDTTLLINISRKGLKHLAKQIVDIELDQIVYIGCCKKYIEQDMFVLCKRYYIRSVKIFDMMPGTDFDVYVIVLFLQD